MAWLPISWSVPQYHVSGEPASGYVLKFYQDGTTTNTNMATDNTGGTLLSDVALDSEGYPSNGGSIFIPHIDQAYKIALYPTQAAADSDTGAVWTIDNLSPADLTDTDTDELAKVSSNDTTAGYLNGKLTGGTGITLTENSDGGNETLDVGLTGNGMLITESADHNNTPVAGKGEYWVDSNGLPRFTDSSAVDYALSGGSQIADHIKAGNLQIWNGENTTTAIVISGVVAASTWESVGPADFVARGTAAADNLWTQMDVLPANAVILLVDLEIVGQSSTPNDSIEVYVAYGDDATPTATNSRNKIFVQQTYFAASSIERGWHRLHIPLGPTNQDFKILWLDDMDVGATVQMYYRGFITD